jgi:phosphoglycerate dehydrogenase-like enzyme
LKIVELAPDADLGAVADAEVIVVAPRANAMLREVWPVAKRVRWVHALAAGVDSLLFPELIESDVVVTNGRGVFAEALGEFTIAAMLWFARDLDRMRRNQREHRWEPFTVERLQGRTAGIVGYGSIGRAAGDRCGALGMNVLALRRTRSDVTLDELLRRSDYVVVAPPLTPSTRGMLGAAQLALLAPHPVVINVGRGPVVDEQALLATLPRIRGAALDVFEQEPLPPDHPLWSCENVLLSPHCADHTSDAHQRARELFAANLARYERGEPLLNIVDKPAGY